MGRSNIRLGQLISTFGPGSLMVDREGISLIICGLDYWFYQEPDATDGSRQSAEKREEFQFNEWRLEEKLDMDYFMEPPDFRKPIGSRNADGPREQNPNLKLSIPSLRFPSYFVCSQAKCNVLRPVEFHLGKRPKCLEHETYGRMNQVRFITICPNGHIDDFPWKSLLGCGDTCPGKLFLSEQGSSDLASIKVRCECGKFEHLGGATSFERDNDTIRSTLSERIRRNTDSQEAGTCRGRRLWHGPNNYEPCDQDIVATFPNATNVFYSKTKTSIFIPVQQNSDGYTKQIRKLVDASRADMTMVKSVWNAGMKANAVDHVRGLIDKNATEFDNPEAAKTQTAEALELYFSDTPVLQQNAEAPAETETIEAAFRRVEFNVLRQKAEEEELRTTPIDVPPNLQNYLELVVQVERLRETRVLHGFDRFMPSPNPAASAAELGDQALRQLYLDPPEKSNRWLPGKIVFGEGIYLELKEDRIKQWQSDQLDWIEQRLTGEYNYQSTFTQLDIDIAPVTSPSSEWISRYLLIHTLAHIVINQLVFECGYSTASLCERLYISDDPVAPMAGLLIYTSAGDSEGTLGGLVRLAQPELLGSVIEHSCQRASWCSADPVCSEVANVDDPNLAACHSCVLLPETSCEVFNKGLDRAMVVGTPARPDTGFFSGLLETTLRQTIISD